MAVAPQAGFRAATATDLPGIWKQVAIHAYDPQLDLSDPGYGGLRYFRFRQLEEGKQLLKVLHLPDDGDRAFPEIREEWEQMPWNAVLRWRPGGRALLTFPAERKQYYLVIAFYTREFDAASLPEERRKGFGEALPSPGDVTLTYVDGDLRPLYFRLLRRVDEP